MLKTKKNRKPKHRAWSLIIISFLSSMVFFFFSYITYLSTSGDFYLKFFGVKILTREHKIGNSIVMLFIGFLFLGLAFIELIYGFFSRYEGTRSTKFKQIKLNDWTSFAAELCIEGAKGFNPSPRICLKLKKFSMAEGLAKFRPSESEKFLTEIPPIIEFIDGTGGICFKVNQGENIRNLLDVLLRGQDYPETLVVTNGVTSQIPTSDKSYVLKQFSAEQGIDFGSVMMW